jgi:hypothetical protein
MTEEQKQIWIGVVQGTALGDIWTAVSVNGLVAVNLWGEREPFIAQVEKLTDITPEYDEVKTAEIAHQHRAVS